MDRPGAGAKPDRETASAFDEMHRLTPGQQLAAQSALDVVEKIIATQEWARHRETTLNHLQFDVRDCAPRVRRMVLEAVEQVHANPKAGPALLRRKARSIDESISATTFPDDDPARAEHDVDSWAAVLMLRDELKTAFDQEGISIDMLRRASNALKVAALALEGC